MKRLAFIDSIHHKETKSSRFLLDFLSPFFAVDIYWDESTTGGSLPDIEAIGKKKYDVVLILGAGGNLNEYSQIDYGSIVAVPHMGLMTAPVKELYPKKLRYLAFSKAQHELLVAMGCTCAWFQYYPSPYDVTPISDYSNLRGFYWCRSPEVSPAMIYELMADATFADLHIHDAALPGVCSLASKCLLPLDAGTSYSEWFNNQKEHVRLLSKANVFFAPRLFERNCYAILEAMSLGMCVVAPDFPSANEYIRHNSNGLLYDPDNLTPLDFSRAAEIGHNARESVKQGYDSWLEQRKGLFSYLAGSPLEQWDWEDALAPAFSQKDDSFNSSAITVSTDRGKEPSLEGGKRLISDDMKHPLLTVATVVRNAVDDLEKTIKSVIGQTFDDFEYIILDGNSSDGTIDTIRRYEKNLDYWVSEPDTGPYQAMCKTANLARGRWLVFMNAGDWFASPQVLQRVFADVHEDPDIIYGDHIWLHEGIPHFHKGLPLSTLQGLLCEKKHNTAHWYHGLPNHQSTFVKTDLLRERPFDSHYKIAADYDFLFEKAFQGCSFLQLDLLISVYQSGGMSSRNEQLCHDEWKEIFSKYEQFALNEKVAGNYKICHFAQSTPRASCQMEEFFSSQAVSRKINSRLAALDAVNPCAKVYITTPCLNAAETIDQTILSVVSQGCGDFAIRYHIQDGGSTDGTVEKLEKWQSLLSSTSPHNMPQQYNNIVFSFSSQSDNGMYQAVARGFEYMDIPSESIMTWINADDILFQGSIASLIRLYRNHSNIHWATGNNCLLSSKGEVLGYNDETTPSDYIRAGFCDGEHWRYVQQEGTFFRKWLWDIADGFNKNLNYAADWDLWRRFAYHAELVHFPLPSGAFRLRRGQLSSCQNTYKDEIDSIIPFTERSAEAKRLAAKRGLNLKIPSIVYENNSYVLDSIALRHFSVPYVGKKLFENYSCLDAMEQPQLTQTTQELRGKDPWVNKIEGIKTYQSSNKYSQLSPRPLAIAGDGNQRTTSIIIPHGRHSSKDKGDTCWFSSSSPNIIHLKTASPGKAKLLFRAQSQKHDCTIDLSVNGKIQYIGLETNTTAIVHIELKAGTNILKLLCSPSGPLKHGDSSQDKFMVSLVSFTPRPFYRSKGFRSQCRRLQKSGLFFDHFYAANAITIMETKASPILHYLLYGAWENKDPNPVFSSGFYLAENSDVYLSGINPLLHYILHGWKEGRDPHPNFSTERYLKDFTDVKDSGMNPLLHYLLHGALEGRRIYPGREKRYIKAIY